MRIDQFHQVVRTDGEGWPCCQNLLADPTVPGDNGWSIEYTYGRTPPQAGILAAAVLACEIARSCTPGAADQCRLPRGVTQVNRQGVTVSFERLTAIAEGRGFGIWEIDQFLAMYPREEGQNAFVVSPDRPVPPVRVDT